MAVGNWLNNRKNSEYFVKTTKVLRREWFEGAPREVTFTEVWLNNCMNEQLDRWTDGRTDGWIHEWWCELKCFPAGEFYVIISLLLPLISNWCGNNSNSAGTWSAAINSVGKALCSVGNNGVTDKSICFKIMHVCLITKGQLKIIVKPKNYSCLLIKIFRKE